MPLPAPQPEDGS